MNYSLVENRRQSRPKITWPNQQKPGQKSFRTWLLILKAIINLNGIDQLTTPLGPWNMDNTQASTEWAAYYDNSNNLIAIPLGETNKYRQYVPTIVRHRSVTYPVQAPFTFIPLLF
jgi:hypothetical protein